MKITCQACQAKYTIADEKIQGKIAKIRCRKCGATVLVDASGGAAAKGDASADAWLVSVAEGDQRTLSVPEIAQAYASNVINDDTYVWKDGMTDWKPLAEMSELISACRSFTQAPVTSEAPPPAASPTPVAARRDPGRAGPDLFAGGAVEDEVATSVPSHILAARQNAQANAAAEAQNAQGGSLTGARDEHSVLFSLSALTGGAKAPAVTSSPLEGAAPAPAARNEDSGLIDLNALAQAQKGRFEQASEGVPVAASPFAFPAALGTVEVPKEPVNKSRMPMFVGGSIALAGVVAAVVILAAGRKDEQPVPVPAASVSAVAPVETVAPSLAATAPTASASAEASASADSQASKAPRRVVPTGRTQPVRPAATPVATPVAPALPPPKRSPCGCAASDLQCQIRCSAMGK